jgi:hypothetical protein
MYSLPTMQVADSPVAKAFAADLERIEAVATLLKEVERKASSVRDRPQEHFCTISHEVMTDPVLTMCGHTFGKSFITQPSVLEVGCHILHTIVHTRTNQSRASIRTRAHPELSHWSTTHLCIPPLSHNDSTYQVVNNALAYAPTLTHTMTHTAVATLVPGRSPCFRRAHSILIPINPLSNLDILLLFSERESVARWFQTQSTCPYCGSRVEKTLIPNLSVRNMINEWQSYYRVQP